MGLQRLRYKAVKKVAPLRVDQSNNDYVHSLFYCDPINTFHVQTRDTGSKPPLEVVWLDAKWIYIDPECAFHVVAQMCIELIWMQICGQVWIGLQCRCQRTPIHMVPHGPDNIYPDSSKLCEKARERTLPRNRRVQGIQLVGGTTESKAQP